MRTQKPLAFLLLCSSVAFGATNNAFYNDTKRGWHYYEAEPQVQEQEKMTKKQEKEKKGLDDEAFMKSVPLNALDSLTVKEYTETFDRVKSIATMKPTKENVKILQAMNKWQTEQSERFAKVWAINLLEDPNLEFPEVADSKFAKNQKMIVEDKRTKEFFEKNKENLAFVVFYSGKNQEGYRNQKAIYDVIEDKYGIEAKYIDLDTNPDLIQRFNLTAFPENFFVYRNSKNEAIWHRVKAGHATLNTIIDTTIFLFDNAILEEDK